MNNIIRPLTVDIKITSGCNLSCAYCVDSKNRSADKLSNIDNVEKFILDLRNHFPIGVIKLWGGEPTLEPEMSNRLIRFAKDNNMGSHIVTNGILIDKMLDTIKECGTKVQISYDGAGTNHIRGNTEGAMEALRKMDELDIEYGVKPTISPYNFDKLAENYLDFRQLRDKLKRKIRYSFSIDYINRIDPADLPSILDTLDKQLDIIIASRMDDVSKGIIPPTCRWFMPSRGLGCSAGKSIIAIDTNGDIYPCHGGFYARTPEMVMGSLDEMGKVITSINTFLSYPPVVTANEKCKACTSNCHNLCSAARFADSKKLTHFERWCDVSSYPELCEIHNFITRKTQPYWDTLGGQNVLPIQSRN